MKALQQNTQEWLEFRRSKIGSSDAPIIMGKSPWKKPYQLWEEKLGIKNHTYETNAMQRGKYLEEEARKAFEEKTGIVVWPDVIIHPEHDFIIASMDGISMDSKVAVELKCPGNKTIEMADKGEIPDHYTIQMQHQMAVTGLEMIYYFCYSGTDGILLEVRRDNTLIDQILEKEIEFHRCMKELKPPTEERIDSEWVIFAKKWKIIQKKKKSIEQQELKCRQGLIDLAGDKSAYGSGVQITRYLKKGRIAYEKIPELKTIDLESYRSQTTECWRLISK